MRIANVNGRATVVTDDGLIDIAKASNGSFSSAVDKLVPQIAKFEKWYSSVQLEPDDPTTPSQMMGSGLLGPVVESPGQIYAVGANYHDHAREMGLAVPTSPMVFAKFKSSLAGPNSPIPIPSQTTDFEAELVVVIGRGGRMIPSEFALDYVAGYCVGQDVSERTMQMAGKTPQFSMGKSFRNFAPVGPWLTTASSVADPNNLPIRCNLNGATMQDSSTGEMVFNVSQIVSFLSSVVELQPGDLIFTGSPSGVGQGRTPPVFLQPGDVLETSIGVLGTIRNECVKS